MEVHEEPWDDIFGMLLHLLNHRRAPHPCFVLYAYYLTMNFLGYAKKSRVLKSDEEEMLLSII